MRKAKITPSHIKLTRDLTGKNIRCWFVVAYAGQRDGVHYWRCMCRASLAEKVVAELEILDRKLNNVVTIVLNHSREAHENLTGWIYGEWTVIGPTSTGIEHRKEPGPFWKCRCICGTERTFSRNDLYPASLPVLCCGCRPEAEVQEEQEWKKRLANEGWDKEIWTARRRIQERQYDKNWTREMERALRRFQPACVICGVTDGLTTHHVQPLYRGHGREPGNAVRLCRACNSFIGIKEPGELPPDMVRKLETAADQFKVHWESGCATPAVPTTTAAEVKPKSPDPALITLLRSVECGDETAIPALADWLEERGDPRASAIREVARLEAVVRETQRGQYEFRYIGGRTWDADVSETQTEAKDVHHWIEFILDGKRFGPSVSVMRSSEDTEDWLAQRVREVQRREIWLRLGLTQTLSGTIKQYLGINNPMGVAATIEEIAQRERKQVQMQTIRNRIESALHLLSFQVRRVPGAPGGVWRAVVGDAPPVCSERARRH